MFHTIVSAYFSEAYVVIFCDTLKIVGSVKMIRIPYSLKELFVLEITSVFYCMIFIFFLKIHASGCGSILLPQPPTNVSWYICY